MNLLLVGRILEQSCENLVSSPPLFLISTNEYTDAGCISMKGFLFLFKKQTSIYFKIKIFTQSLLIYDQLSPNKQQKSTPKSCSCSSLSLDQKGKTGKFQKKRTKIIVFYWNIIYSWKYRNNRIKQVFFLILLSSLYLIFHLQHKRYLIL